MTLLYNILKFIVASVALIVTVGGFYALVAFIAIWWEQRKHTQFRVKKSRAAIGPTWRVQYRTRLVWHNLSGKIHTEEWEAYNEHDAAKRNYYEAPF